MDIYLSINVYGKELETCCDNPKTGFFRNGMCDTCKEDLGVHTVCILATEEFLVFSKGAGNDLSTPRPEYNFTGVKPGNRWCLCAMRWKEAYEQGKAPPVFLESTHEATLKLVDFNILQQYAVN
ncbi:MAG TPA: DUF2237 domain-containing protein [Candidatus Marinimicrobia bacterium]|jgi:uncharacterized protein (DUF2237 family)|nr:DUF2237 domain-containing protein [Candidatus Neomarinimicrobiota bacterium]